MRYGHTDVRTNGQRGDYMSPQHISGRLKKMLMECVSNYGQTEKKPDRQRDTFWHNQTLKT